jgi:hypothetical protein
MVRWIDGLLGGALAGVTSLVFFTLVGVAWLHDTTCEEFLTATTRLFPALRGVPPSVPLMVLGTVLYLALAALLGLVYALLARRLASMRRPPTSMVWGLVYGVAVWLLVNDVLVPAFGIVSYQPLWEGLVGCAIFYGVVLSEWTAFADRRAASSADLAAGFVTAP